MKRYKKLISSIQHRFMDDTSLRAISLYRKDCVKSIKLFEYLININFFPRLEMECLNYNEFFCITLFNPYYEEEFN